MVFTYMYVPANTAASNPALHLQLLRHTYMLCHRVMCHRMTLNLRVTCEYLCNLVSS